jgi:hypothetical protein
MASRSGSSPITAVEYEYEYSEEPEPVKPKPAFRRIGQLQQNFGRGRSMSSTTAPKNFVAPQITEFSHSDLPKLRKGKTTRFKSKHHRHVWFVIDTTSFTGQKHHLKALKLLRLFRSIDLKRIRVNAILFYDHKVINPDLYDETNDAVDAETHVGFGGTQNEVPMLTHKEVRKTIKRYEAKQGLANEKYVEYRTIPKSAQNAGGRIALFGAVARELIAEKIKPTRLPKSLLIFAAQTDSLTHEVCEQGMEAVRAMHGTGMVWTVRAYSELQMLYGELVQVG